jgi:hypothetical protein
MVRGVPGQLQALLAQLDAGAGPVCALLTELQLLPGPSSPAPPAAQQPETLLQGEQGGGRAALQLFRAALADLLAFFESEYMPNARPESGCGGLLAGAEAGAEVYAQCLKYHTTTDLTADEVRSSRSNSAVQ